MGTALPWLNPMQFASHLIQFRKAQGGLADAAQIRAAKKGCLL